MRSFLLIATMVLAAAGSTGCNRATDIPDGMHAMIEKGGAAPLQNARIQLREVAQPGATNVTALNDREGNPLSVQEPSFITTADIASVAISNDAQAGNATLVLHFTDAAAPRILAATQAHVGRQVALTVGDQVLSVAFVSGPFAKAMQVSGLGADEEAYRLYTEITGQTP